MTTTYILLTIAGLIIIRLALFIKKKQDLAEKKRDEFLAEELIYDPETGVKKTLEQAENSTAIEPHHYNRIKTDEEILKYFDDNGQAVEFVKRALFQQDFNYFEDAEFLNDLCAGVYQLDIIKPYHFAAVLEAFEISDRSSLLLLQVGSHPNEELHYLDDRQIMGVVELIEPIGDVLIADSSYLKNLLLNLQKDEMTKSIGNNRVVYEDVVYHDAYLNKVIEVLGEIRACTVEITENHLFFKFDRQMTVDLLNLTLKKLQALETISLN